MTQPYTLTGPIGSKGTLGLITLQSDETLEQDMRAIFATPELALHFTRIPSGTEVTPETLARMEQDLPHAASLLPPTAAHDCVGYGCTSGTMQIGAARVAELVRSGCDTRGATDPLTGAIAALRHLGKSRIGIVSPYIAPVAEPLGRAFEAAGFTLSGSLSFGIEVEGIVARIDPRSTAEAARVLAAQSTPEALFLSCTNLRTREIVSDLEAELGIPVLSSNLALAWHMATHLPEPVALDAPGQLFARR